MTQQEFEVASCPICGSSDSIPLAKRGQFDLPCHVAICPNDGMVFLNPRWTLNRYLRFYQTEYDSYYRPAVVTGESDQLKYRCIREIWERLGEHDLLGDPRNLLDVGAGMGWALQWMQQQLDNPCRLYAIEPSDHCRSHLEQQVKAQVVAEDIESDWSTPPIDLAILRHVLEHFQDPVLALEKVRASLSPTGLVYIAVPNMMRPRGSLRYYWYRAVHTYYFSAATLVRVASKAGLSPVVIESDGQELWSVMRSDAGAGDTQPSANVFVDQMRVIRRQQRSRILPDLRLAIRHWRKK